MRHAIRGKDLLQASPKTACLVAKLPLDLGCASRADEITVGYDADSVLHTACMVSRYVSHSASFVAGQFFASVFSPAIAQKYSTDKKKQNGKHGEQEARLFVHKISGKQEAASYKRTFRLLKNCESAS